MSRKHLADRWEVEIVAFEHDRRLWTATFGRIEDSRVAEIFLDASKVSMPAETRSFSLKCWGSHPARRRCGLSLFRPYV